MNPIYKVGDEAWITDRARKCFIRQVFEDRHAPYYEVVLYMEDINKEPSENTPRNLQWEHELKPGRKTRTLKNGKVIYAEPSK